MSFLSNYPQVELIQILAIKQRTKVYLVGGFVRDYVLGVPNKDLDFAVEKGALKLAKAFADQIKGAYILLDQERGCARVAKKEKGGLLTFDFAEFRAKTFKADLALRDFTINTLSVDIATIKPNTDFKEIITDHKGGLKDIKAKKIQMTSTKAFKDDPLRMLRAFSLQASLGFKITSSTSMQIKKEKALIRGVSYERVRDELFKILESGRAAETFKALDKIGLLEEVIPQIHVIYNCKQGGYHHLDVWPHTLEAVRQLELIIQQLKSRPGELINKEADQELVEYLNESLAGNRSRSALLVLGILLHDIGKPDTRKKELDGRISFHSHEKVGKDIVRPIAKMLKLGTNERFTLEDLVFFHLRPGYLSNFKKPSERMVFRYFRDTKNEAMSILLLSLADQRATCGPMTTQEDQKHHEKICLSLIKRCLDQRKQKPFVRLIDGNDLIKEFNLKPSAIFGTILQKVEEQQALGKISTREEAFKVARGMI